MLFVSAWLPFAPNVLRRRPVPVSAWGTLKRAFERRNTVSAAPPDPSSRVEVVDVPAGSRYEARIVSDDGSSPPEVAIAMYERRPGRITFLHTVVPAAMEGRGVASRIARVA